MRSFPNINVIYFWKHFSNKLTRAKFETSGCILALRYTNKAPVSTYIQWQLFLKPQQWIWLILNASTYLKRCFGVWLNVNSFRHWQLLGLRESWDGHQTNPCRIRKWFKFYQCGFPCQIAIQIWGLSIKQKP